MGRAVFVVTCPAQSSAQHPRFCFRVQTKNIKPYLTYGVKEIQLFLKKNEMNQSKGAFQRYRVIDSLLRNPMKPYPGMEDIRDYCERKLDYKPSAETIQKDIRDMKLPFPDGFDAPIHYSRLHGGYAYTDANFSLAGVALQQAELDVIAEAVEVLRAIGSSRLGNKFSHALHKLLSASMEHRQETGALPVLQTMVPPVSQGFAHFDLYYQACTERIALSLLYYSYRNRVYGHHLLHPFLIKEFENRWYLVGYSEHHGAVRVFGLDRISEPELLRVPYRPTDPDEIIRYLGDLYGVHPLPGSEKTLITLRADELATHYFNAYPLHHSQRIEKRSDGTSLITYSLVPTRELAHYILSLGNQVTLLSPDWFRAYTQDIQS